MRRAHGAIVQGQSLISFQQNLAVLSLLLQGDHRAATERLQQGMPPIDALVQFVRRHQLRLYVLEQLAGSPLLDVVPRDVGEQLARHGVTQRTKQDALLHELDRLSVLFQRNAVDFTLLKGPYFGERFFGGAHRRFFADLDILIRPDQFARARAVLRDAGYIRQSTILLSVALCARFTHGCDFARDGLRLDLHWSLGVHACYRLDHAAIWRERQPFHFRDKDFAVLSDDHTLLFHLLSFFEDLDRGAARLKAFVDLYAILAQLDDQLDWPAFFAHRTREHTGRICRTILALFLDLLDCAERFPRLATAISDTICQLQATPWATKEALIQASHGALRNKLWAAGAYECHRLTVLGWWLISLPFRLAVYHPGRLGRLARRARG